VRPDKVADRRGKRSGHRVPTRRPPVRSDRRSRAPRSPTRIRACSPTR
jgi:hypothetical protein